MNLKNQPTVMMPSELMFDIERDWKMSKAAWMDVAWDLMQEMIASSDHLLIEQRLKERAELIQMYRKRDKAA